eukprot:6538435-Pyramimonas_sp.AAC.1
MANQGGVQKPVPCGFICGRDSCSKDCVDPDKPIMWGKGDADRLLLPNGTTAVYGSDADWYCERTYIQIYRCQYPDRKKFQMLLAEDKAVMAQFTKDRLDGGGMKSTGVSGSKAPFDRLTLMY